MNFEGATKKRTIQIQGLIQYMKTVEINLKEDKSHTFFSQKGNQLRSMWDRILQTTDIMMAYDQYNKIHQNELNDIQEAYDDIIIKIEEKQVSSKRKIKLPVIDIPTFNGDMTQWTSFFNLFSTVIIKDETLSDTERFYYLKTKVIDEAAQLVSHLQATEDNFKIAWQLLKRRYDNHRRMVEAHVKKILNQPRVTNNSATQLKELHDTTKECILALQNLEINTTDADFMLNVIIEEKMDGESIRLYETSLEDRKTQQKFDDLLKFLEKRFQTLESIETNNESKNSRH